MAGTPVPERRAGAAMPFHKNLRHYYFPFVMIRHIVIDGSLCFANGILPPPAPLLNGAGGLRFD